MAKKRRKTRTRASSNPNVPAMAQAMKKMKRKSMPASMMGPDGAITATGATETPMGRKRKKKKGR